MDFYFDENLPSRVARALNELEGNKSDINVYSTEDQWGKGVTDEKLIEMIRERKGIWVTNDKKLRTRISQFQLIKKSGISVVIITFPSGMNFQQKYLTIISKWEEIKALPIKNKRPFVCKIPKRGKDITYY